MTDLRIDPSTAIRLGRNPGHLIALADEFRTLGVDLVTTEGIDTTMPHGKLQFHFSARSRLSEVRCLSVRKSAAALGCAPGTIQKLRSV
jgi:DNA invertase Pin-like site-specific DNA recombinase